MAMLESPIVDPMHKIFNDRPSCERILLSISWRGKWIRVTMKMAVFWVVSPCSLVEVY
jgi:hypothetical protein